MKLLKRNRSIAFLYNLNRDKRGSLGNRIQHAVKEMDTSDTKTSHFYIDKNNTENRSFQDIFEKSRKIRFLTNIENREICDKIQIILQETLKGDEVINHLHGFLTNKGIYTFRENINERWILKVDLENAFEQISENWVYTYFRSVCDLNKKDSEFLTKICTYKGRVYQGNPISPMLFNCYYAAAIKALTKMKDINVQAYADDIIIASNKKISWGFRRYLLKVLASYQLKVNDKKCIFNSNKDVYYLGLELKRNKVRKGQLFKKRIRHKVHKIFHESQNLTREEIEHLWQQAKGYKGWLISGEYLGINKLMENLT